MITQNEMLRLFDYDGQNLIWRQRPLKDFKAKHFRNSWNTQFSGKVAGYVNGHGYVCIALNGVKYQAHRLIFLRQHGYLPVEIDHINHIRNDNRLENLRAADRVMNCRNMKRPSNNMSGCTGVYWREPNNKWLVQIKVNRRTINIGYFVTFDDACAARAAAEIEYGFHPNHGSS